MPDARNMQGLDETAGDEWSVLVVFEGDDPGSKLVADLERLLEGFGPRAVFSSQRLIVAELRRRGDTAAAAAQSAIRDVELWGFCPEAVMSGRPGTEMPEFLMERVHADD